MPTLHWLTRDANIRAANHVPYRPSDLFSDDPDADNMLSRTRLTDKEVTMNCTHCHGQMKRSKALFHVDRNGYHLVFDTVPAWVCEQCGEAYFEEREVDAIQNAIKGLDQQAQQLVTDI